MIHLIWSFSHLSGATQAGAANLFSMMLFDLIKKGDNMFHHSVYIDDPNIYHMPNVAGESLEKNFIKFSKWWSIRNGTYEEITISYVKENVMVTSDIKTALDHKKSSPAIFILNTSFLTNELINKVKKYDCLVLEMGDMWKRITTVGFRNAMFCIPGIDKKSSPITIKGNHSRLHIGPAVYPYLVNCDEIIAKMPINTLENNKKEGQLPTRIFSGAKDIMERLPIKEWEDVIIPIALTRNVSWMVVGADKNDFRKIIKRLKLTKNQTDIVYSKFNFFPFTNGPAKLINYIHGNKILYKGSYSGSGTLCAICSQLGLAVMHYEGSDGCMYIGDSHLAKDLDDARKKMKSLIDNQEECNSAVKLQQSYLKTINNKWQESFKKSVDVVINNSCYK